MFEKQHEILERWRELGANKREAPNSSEEILFVAIIELIEHLPDSEMETKHTLLGALISINKKNTDILLRAQLIKELDLLELYVYKYEQLGSLRVTKAIEKWIKIVHKAYS